MASVGAKRIMKSVRLTRAKADDVDQILRIEKSVSGLITYSALANRKEALSFMKKHTVFLIKKGGETVGNVSYSLKGLRLAQISGFVIIPRFQRKGIGRQALALLLKKLKKAGKIDLVTHPRNTPALRLYLSFGFVIESWKNNYFGDGEPRLVLSREKKERWDPSFH